MFRLSLITLFAALTLLPAAFAQEASDELLDLSLEELMNIPIESASRKEESSFEAPLSSFAITREEISRSGATSIPEALRLSPGLIVRETTNGNYDIHIRGFENLPRYTSTTSQNNQISLVMIDNRPVFNYNQGGVFWESLPIDLVDVERIEIVRGPTSPLFGPNAVSGVINIITRHPEEDGLYTSANVQGGLPHSLIANAAAGYRMGNKWNVHFSANHQQRERHDELQYIYNSDMFVDDLQSLPIPESSLVQAEQALERSGANAYFTFKPADHAGIELSLGMQQAQAQKLHFNSDSTALRLSENDSRYINLTGHFHDFNFRFSHNTGRDHLQLGSQILVPEYDFRVSDLVLDYTWQISEKLSLRPEVNLQQATYSDEAYLESGLFGGFLNASRTVRSMAASLRAEYRITEPWRLVAALRSDRFETPDQRYFSYQLASTYKLNKNILFRAAHARSNSGAFIANTFLNVEISTPFGTNRIIGNPELSLTTNTATEIGLRAQPIKELQIDLALFIQQLEDLNEITLTEVDLLNMRVTQQYTNLPLSARQHGMTLSANFIPDARLQIRPFVTLQQTIARDVPINVKMNLQDVIEEEEHESTPNIYGGLVANYLLSPRLNFNMNAYFFGQHTLYHVADTQRQGNTGDISAKLLMNAKLSYRAFDKFNLYLNGRNVLNNNSREHYGTDRIGRSLLAGMSYHF